MNVCTKSISCGGQSRASFNTTNLIKHLKKHKEQHEEYTKLTKGNAEMAKPKQLTLEAALGRREKFPCNSVKARKITERVTEMIVMDNQPISIMEDTGFWRHLELLEPRYGLPSRHYVTDKSLPALFTKVCAHVQDLLSDVPVISFTTDSWSSNVNPMALLSLMAHWIDSNFALKAAILNVCQFCKSHTAENIRLAIMKMLNKWQLDKQCVHVILRDNAKT